MYSSSRNQFVSSSCRFITVTTINGRRAATDEKTSPRPCPPWRLTLRPFSKFQVRTRGFRTRATPFSLQKNTIFNGNTMSRAQKPFFDRTLRPQTLTHCTRHLNRWFTGPVECNSSLFKERTRRSHWSVTVHSFQSNPKRSCSKFPRLVASFYSLILLLPFFILPLHFHSLFAFSRARNEKYRRPDDTS